MAGINNPSMASNMSGFSTNDFSYYFGNDAKNDIDVILKCNPKKNEVLSVDKNGRLFIKAFEGRGANIKAFFCKLLDSAKVKKSLKILAGKVTSLPPSPQALAVQNQFSQVMQMVTEKKIANADIHFLPKLMESYFKKDAQGQYESDSKSSCQLYSFMLADPEDFIKYLKKHPKIPGITPEEIKLLSEIASKIKHYGLESEQIEKTLAKFKKVNERLNANQTIPESERLTFKDLRTFQGAKYLDKFIGNHVRIVSNQEDGKNLITPELKALHDLVELQNHPESEKLKNSLFEGNQSGDVVFFDMRAKERFGDTISKTQTLYENYSHFGFFNSEIQTSTRESGEVETSRSSPQYIDVLPYARAKIIEPLKMSFLPKLSLDFSKIFQGYKELPPEIQVQIQKRYAAKIQEVGKNPDKYQFKMGLDFSKLSGLKRLIKVFFTKRTYHPNPLGMNKLLESAADKTNRITEAAYCSGFIAGVIYQVCNEIQEELSEEEEDYEKSFAFTKNFSMDVTNFTPRDLINWNVWDIEKAKKGRSSEFNQIMALEVVKSSEALYRRVAKRSEK